MFSFRGLLQSFYSCIEMRGYFRCVAGFFRCYTKCSLYDMLRECFAQSTLKDSVEMSTPLHYLELLIFSLVHYMELKNSSLKTEELLGRSNFSP